MKRSPYSPRPSAKVIRSQIAHAKNLADAERIRKEREKQETEPPETCEHSLKRDSILGGHYCIKCRAHFPYGCMWDEN